MWKNPNDETLNEIDHFLANKQYISAAIEIFIDFNQTVKTSN